MKYPLLLLTFLICTSTSFAQKKLIQRLLSNEKDTTRKASFLPIPVAGYGQEKGFEFGVGFIYSYYTDRKDTLNRSSNLAGTLTYSTKKTYNLTLKGDIWTNANTYHLIGEIRFKKMPFNYYGIGNNTFAADADKLTQQQFKVLVEAERQIAPSFYSGVSIGYESYDFTDHISGGIFSQQLKGYNGGNVGFAGLSQSYDTRNSNNYPTKGFYGRITYQFAPEIHKSTNYSGSQAKINLRGFIPFSSQLTLGLQGFYHIVQGRNIPFYLLPQLGNDELMRGYYTGRYRDEQLLAAQAELRYRYNNRFGAVLFAGTGTVFGQADFKIADLKPNYGAGLRYFFDPAKGLSIRMDYGIGEKRYNEKRQTGFYISLGEAF